MEINTGFYYYLNYPNAKVTIRNSSCRFCNNGMGIQVNIHGDYNGIWSERFDTLNDAILDLEAKVQTINSNRNIVLKYCQVCISNK